MKRAIIYGILGGLLLFAIGSAAGMLIGMDVGGNYFTDFEFGGVRGYEATGKLGSILGGIFGALLGAAAGVIFGERRRRSE